MFRKKCVMDKLLLDIQIKRNEMIECGLRSGLNSDETIQASEELDMLILQYQRYKEELDKSFLYRLSMTQYVLQRWKTILTKTLTAMVVSMTK